MSERRANVDVVARDAGQSPTERATRKRGIRNVFHTREIGRCSTPPGCLPLATSGMLALIFPVPALHSKSLWANRREAALATLYNPLVVQIGTSELPAGSFYRLMEDRA